MAKHNNKRKLDTLPIEAEASALDNDVLAFITMGHDAQTPVTEPKTVARMLDNIRYRIKHEQHTAVSAQESLQTLRSHEGQWITITSGVTVKILQGDITMPKKPLSYLIKLEAGLTFTGHDHPFDEECLMLEGDLSMGAITLNKGDFHFAAAGVPHSRLSTKNGCTAYIRGALPT